MSLTARDELGRVETAGNTEGLIQLNRVDKSAAVCVGLW
jgi:hypothetical protein